MSERDFVKEDIDRFENFKSHHDRLNDSLIDLEVSPDAILTAAAILHQTDTLLEGMDASAKNLATLCGLIEDRF